MTDHRQHPITPPKIMVGQWLTEAADLGLLIPTNLDYLATQAAQWGWDQREPEIQKARDEELDACEKWIKDQGYHPEVARDFRAARRPSLSLAEQATAELDEAVMRGDCITTTNAIPLLRAALNRLAELEALPDA